MQEQISGSAMWIKHTKHTAPDMKVYGYVIKTHGAF